MCAKFGNNEAVMKTTYQQAYDFWMKIQGRAQAYTMLGESFSQ